MKTTRANFVAANRKTGFSLIELMVTVAIVAILATIAYPSFIEQVRKSRRADAKAGLTETVQNIERAYTMSNSYASAVDTVLGASAVVPKEYYDITSTAADAVSFALEATPKGAQAADACGNFTLDNLGTKGVNSGTILDPTLCW